VSSFSLYPSPLGKGGYTYTEKGLITLERQAEFILHLMIIKYKRRTFVKEFFKKSAGSRGHTGDKDFHTLTRGFLAKMVPYRWGWETAGMVFRL